MQKSITTNSLAPVVAASKNPPRTSQPESIGESGHTSGSAVIVLPPNRDQLAEDLRAINRQSFLIICELHRGLLVNLVDVPGRILVAAKNLVKPKGIADWSKLWSEAIVLHAEALTNSREQLLAATRSHGLSEQGQIASEAIKSIEKMLPSFLQAVAQTSESHLNLASAATRLSSAARTLDKIFADLLVTVEHSIQRASGHNASNQPGFQKQIP